MTSQTDLPLVSDAAESSSCSCCATDAQAPAETVAIGTVVAEYTVTGMTCSHCAASVTEEVRALDAVQDVTVDLDSGRLVVASSAVVSAEAIRGAVAEAGYSVVD